MIVLYTERYDILTIYYYDEDNVLRYIDIYADGYCSEGVSCITNLSTIRHYYGDEIIHDDNL